MDFSDSWLYSVGPPGTGPHNMRVDESLLHFAEQRPERVTFLRFYSWALPTVSLGKHQRARRAVDLTYCHRMKIPVVHRPSGGRAVYHDSELTYAIVSNDPGYFPISSVTGTYHVIAAALREGLRQLGILARLAPPGRHQRDRYPQSEFKAPCFVSASRCELLSNGRKLIGSAQRRLKRSFLQHGSVPLEVDYYTMAAALGVKEQLLKTTLTSVSEAKGEKVDFGVLRKALEKGFESRFKAKLTVFRPEEHRQVWSR